MNTESIIAIVDADLKEFAPNYIENKKAEIIKMQAALNENNFKVIEVFGHQLKGSAGSYGFDPMGLIGARLESNAIKNDIPNLQIALKELEGYLSRVQITYKEE